MKKLLFLAGSIFLQSHSLSCNSLSLVSTHVVLAGYEEGHTKDHDAYIKNVPSTFGIGDIIFARTVGSSIDTLDYVAEQDSTALGGSRYRINVIEP